MGFTEGQRLGEMTNTEQLLVPAPAVNVRRIVASGWIENPNSASVVVTLRQHHGDQYAERVVTIPAESAWEFSARMILDGSRQKLTASTSTAPTERLQFGFAWADHDA